MTVRELFSYRICLVPFKWNLFVLHRLHIAIPVIDALWVNTKCDLFAQLFALLLLISQFPHKQQYRNCKKSQKSALTADMKWFYDFDWSSYGKTELNSISNHLWSSLFFFSQHRSIFASHEWTVDGEKKSVWSNCILHSLWIQLN